VQQQVACFLKNRRKSRDGVGHYGSTIQPLLLNTLLLAHLKDY